jgi:hypothetical protein
MGDGWASVRRCVVVLALLAGACDHQPIAFLTSGDPPPATPDSGVDAPADLGIDLAAEAGEDLAPDLAPPLQAPPPPGCKPQPEICNGADDDCDGKVDEDQAAIPCPNGGERYCVAGRLSECPRVCDVCRPGSRRVCFISYCTYWGAQTCAADGRSFGLCRESPVPPECEGVAKSKKKSPELERCCLDNGYCCRDEYDLDGDGDRGEMLGRCGAVTCPS